MWSVGPACWERPEESSRARPTASLNQPRAEQPGSWGIGKRGPEEAEGSRGGWKRGAAAPGLDAVRAGGPAVFGEGIGNVAATAEQGGQ